MAPFFGTRVHGSKRRKGRLNSAVGGVNDGASVRAPEVAEAHELNQKRREPSPTSSSPSSERRQGAQDSLESAARGTFPVVAGGQREGEGSSLTATILTSNLNVADKAGHEEDDDARPTTTTPLTLVPTPPASNIRAGATDRLVVPRVSSSIPSLARNEWSRSGEVREASMGSAPGGIFQEQEKKKDASISNDNKSTQPNSEFHYNGHSSDINPKTGGRSSGEGHNIPGVSSSRNNSSTTFFAQQSSASSSSALHLRPPGPTSSMNPSGREEASGLSEKRYVPQTSQMSNAPSDTAITIIDADTGPRIALYEALYSIEGMTCAACTGKVQETIEALPGVKQVSVALMTNSATVQFEGLKEDAAKVVDEIEDIGFDCRLEDIKECGIPGAAKTVERTAMIKIEGMRSGECPAKVLDALTTSFQDRIIVNKEPTLADPVIQITYLPAPPEFTIRHIISRINASDPGFVATVYHPPTIEERSREIQQKDFKKLAIRLIICIIIAIPTFLIGIVWMSLVPSTNPVRSYFEQPMWAGRANRLEWALFFLATPVQFFIADVFHIKAFKELRAIWRPGSSVPILKRFYKFGSMSLLISLGVSIAYFSSIGLLAVAARSSGDSMGHHTTYFDSTVFLTMFLLLGKCLEAYSKSKTADAVSMLGKLRPSEALLLVDESASSTNPSTPLAVDDGASSSVSAEKAPEQGRHMESASRGIKRIPVEMLEVGDTILVQNGGSPPADGLISVGQTKFDESSLTGEAKPVIKNVGDEVFAGTINRGNAVNVVIDAVDGESMLDQIVKVVREGQTRKAPIERVADMITGYFVPVVTLIAITTWVVWLSLGLTGHLPPQYLDVDQGGWPVWSLGFAISVFVVACPCGIGLAAPTALFVGSGLAAKYGILAKGGGEAFQEASMLNVIVFDKTGTLTEGGEPRVTDEKVFEHLDGGMVYSVAMKLEEASSHPLARAVLGFCEGKPRTIRTAVGGSGDVEEIPGRGMKGIINVEGSEGSSLSYEAIIGNEAFMAESGVPPLDGVVDALLHSWKSKGKSVVLLAMRPITTTSPTSVDPLPSSQFTLSAIFSATDPIRKESRAVVNYLQTNLHLQVWLISGDNHTTTHSVAAQVGIPLTNVIASVLPHEKALHVRRLQQLPPPPGSRGNAKRNIVAMVGDGINDAPALSTSDVAIAIGSGSDIALSTSSFVLLNSDLWGVVRLVHLSRKVLSRVRWNFAWACVYNIIAVPVAAGVLYPVGMRGWRKAVDHVVMMEMEVSGMGHAVGSGGSRIRLDPAWASLAMALSSVSVICSSLMLRTRWWGVGFRPVEGSGSSSGSGGEGWRRDEKEGKDGKGKSLVEERREEEGLVV